MEDVQTIPVEWERAIQRLTEVEPERYWILIPELYPATRLPVISIDKGEPITYYRAEAEAPSKAVWHGGEWCALLNGKGDIVGTGHMDRHRRAYQLHPGDRLVITLRVTS
jgi:hypothetical protein